MSGLETIYTPLRFSNLLKPLAFRYNRNLIHFKNNMKNKKRFNGIGKNRIALSTTVIVLILHLSNNRSNDAFYLFIYTFSLGHDIILISYT